MTHILLLVLLLAYPARASTTTELALSVACPGHLDLAPHVDAASRRYMVDRVTLVALMAVESGCRMDKVGTHGEVCATQLHGVARNGYSRRALRSDPALCVSTGARWLSLRMVDCCALGALSIGGYNAKECRHGKRYARRVLRAAARIWRVLDGREKS
jgi:hypothetical protein